MAGIKETRDALIALNEILLVLAKHLKSISPIATPAAIASELLSNKELQQALYQAVIGANNIPEEIKDLEMSEIFELAQVQISYLPKLLKAFVKF